MLTRAFLEHGARVAAFDVAEVALAGLTTELESAGYAGRFLTGEVDVSDWRACEAGVESCVDALGGLDVLVNNAALGMGAVRMDHMTRLVGIEELAPDVWDAFVGANLSGAWYMTRFAGSADGFVTRKVREKKGWPCTTR